MVAVVVVVVVAAVVVVVIVVIVIVVVVVVEVVAAAAAAVAVVEVSCTLPCNLMTQVSDPHVIVRCISGNVDHVYRMILGGNY